MKVFLSYSAANKVFATNLRKALVGLGVAVWSDGSEPGAQGRPLSERLEAAIRSASHILLVIGPRDGRNVKDAPQELIRPLILEAAWRDRSKRLIPVLLRDAALPAFVLSAFPLSSMEGAEIPVIRVRDPRDVGEAARAVLKVIQGEVGHSAGASSAHTREGDDASPRSDGPDRGVPLIPLSVVFESSGPADASTKRGYLARLDEIEQLAKNLKR